MGQPTAADGHPTPVGPRVRTELRPGDGGPAVLCLSSHRDGGAPYGAQTSRVTAGVPFKHRHPLPKPRPGTQTVRSGARHGQKQVRNIDAGGASAKAAPKRFLGFLWKWCEHRPNIRQIDCLETEKRHYCTGNRSSHTPPPPWGWGGVIWGPGQRQRTPRPDISNVFLWEKMKLFERCEIGGQCLAH